MPPVAKTQPTTQAPFTTALLAVLGAIGTGIGVIGFLTFIGGATWVARFRGLELSGTYAISAMPRSELIATGADQLFDPAVVAFAAAALAVGLFLIARWQRLDRTELTKGVAVFAGLGAIGLGWWFHCNVGRFLGEDVSMAFVGATTTVAVGAGLIFLLARRAYPDEGPLDGARVLALALAVAGTVLIYGAFETYALNHVHPHVRGVAVVEPDGSGVFGYYVGQDADTIFIGVVSPRLPGSRPRSNRRIVQVPLTDESRIAIGSALNPPGAHRMAKKLRADLQRQFAQGGN